MTAIEIVRWAIAGLAVLNAVAAWQFARESRAHAARAKDALEKLKSGRR